MTRPRPLRGIRLPTVPDPATLQWHAAAGEAELFEIGPDQLGLVPWLLRTDRPVVSRGARFGLGAAPPPRHRALVLAAVRELSRAVDLRWHAESLGVHCFADRSFDVALPVPDTEAVTRAQCDGIRELQSVTPEVLVVNAATYFHLSDPLEQPVRIARLCAVTGCGVALDLHAAHCVSSNAGHALDRWLDAVPLGAVTQLILSGGVTRVAGGRTFAVHDEPGPIPDAVWQGLERMLAACPVRAIVLDAGTDDARVAFDWLARQQDALRGIAC